MNDDIIPEGPTEIITNGTVIRDTLLLYAETDLSILAVQYSYPAVPPTPTLTSVFTLKAGRHLFDVAALIFTGTATFIYRSADYVAVAALSIKGAGNDGSGGSINVNGIYTQRGTLNGFPIYTKLGSPDSFIPFAVNSIYSTGSRWIISSAVGDPVYYSDNIVSQPWLVTTWVADAGQAPLPIVTAL